MEQKAAITLTVVSVVKIQRFYASLCSKEADIGPLSGEEANRDNANNVVNPVLHLRWVGYSHARDIYDHIAIVGNKRLAINHTKFGLTA